MTGMGLKNRTRLQIWKAQSLESVYLSSTDVHHLTTLWIIRAAPKWYTIFLSCTLSHLNSTS